MFVILKNFMFTTNFRLRKLEFLFVTHNFRDCFCITYFVTQFPSKYIVAVICLTVTLDHTWISCSSWLLWLTRFAWISRLPWMSRLPRFARLSWLPWISCLSGFTGASRQPCLTGLSWVTWTAWLPWISRSTWVSLSSWSTRTS